MFGLGFTEIFLVFVVAIIALGPEKLPGVMVDIAKMFKKLKSQFNDAKASIDDELKLSELKQEALEYKESLTSSANEFKASALNDLDDIEDSFNDLDAISDDTKESIKKESSKFPKKRYKEKKSKKRKSEDKDLSDA